jgi:hypothetical protein
VIAGERLAREAVAIAEGTDFLTMHGDALVSQAIVAQLAGRRGEAQPLVDRALELYAAKGNVAAATAAVELVAGSEPAGTAAP